MALGATASFAGGFAGNLAGTVYTSWHNSGFKSVDVDWGGEHWQHLQLVRYSWGIKETKTNIKHKTNSEFAIRSPKIIGLLILIYSSKFDNKSLVKISKFDMIKIKRHRNALSNNGKALKRTSHRE